jgi:hypothetical protein
VKLHVQVSTNFIATRPHPAPLTAAGVVSESFNFVGREFLLIPVFVVNFASTSRVVRSSFFFSTFFRLFRSNHRVEMPGEIRFTAVRFEGREQV